MSSSITDPKNNTSGHDATSDVASPQGKGKSKDKAKVEEQDDDDDDDEEENDDDEEEEEEEEETYEEIDPSAIIPTGRRTRGVKVDYTSKEALEKAGLADNEKDEDSDDDVEMKD